MNKEPSFSYVIPLKSIKACPSILNRNFHLRSITHSSNKKPIYRTKLVLYIGFLLRSVDEKDPPYRREYKGIKEKRAWNANCVQTQLYSCDKKDAVGGEGAAKSW